MCEGRRASAAGSLTTAPVRGYAQRSRCWPGGCTPTKGARLCWSSSRSWLLCATCCRICAHAVVSKTSLPGGCPGPVLSHPATAGGMCGAVRATRLQIFSFLLCSMLCEVACVQQLPPGVMAQMLQCWSLHGNETHGIFSARARSLPCHCMARYSCAAWAACCWSCTVPSRRQRTCSFCMFERCRWAG